MLGGQRRRVGRNMELSRINNNKFIQHPNEQNYIPILNLILPPHRLKMAQKCVHQSCGKMYSDPEEECLYHPGPPIFHEGQKGTNPLPQQRECPSTLHNYIN